MSPSAQRTSNDFLKSHTFTSDSKVLISGNDLKSGRCDLDSQIADSLNSIRKFARDTNVTEKLRDPDLKKDFMTKALITRKEPTQVV